MIKAVVKVTALTALLTTGCSIQESNETNDKLEVVVTSEEGLAYSNLNNVQTLNQINDLLEKNQIDTNDIKLFNQSVQNYYRSIGDTPLFSKQNELNSTLQLPYNVYELSEVWEENNPDLIDQNCRITSFRLFNDFISLKVNEENVINTDTLEFDLSALTENPDAKISEEELQKFINLFAIIPVTDKTNVKKVSEEITNELQERGIHFVNPENISIINGYLPDEEEDFVSVGHTGVAITTNEGIIFIEKYGFGLPYQVTKFESKEELKNYMVDRMYVGAMGSTQLLEPIIMENDKLM